MIPVHDYECNEVKFYCTIQRNICFSIYTRNNFDFEMYKTFSVNNLLCKMCFLYTHKIRDNITKEKLIKKKLVKGQTSANRNSLQIQNPLIY